MVEDSRGLRFLLEAAQPVGVLREGRRQHLDRDLAAEARILRAVHLAHPPGADLAEDLVGAELRAGRERHRSPRRDVEVGRDRATVAVGVPLLVRRDVDAGLLDDAGDVRRSELLPGLAPAGRDVHARRRAREGFRSRRRGWTFRRRSSGSGRPWWCSEWSSSRRRTWIRTRSSFQPVPVGRRSTGRRGRSGCRRGRSLRRDRSRLSGGDVLEV